MNKYMVQLITPGDQENDEPLVDIIDYYMTEDEAEDLVENMIAFGYPEDDLLIVEYKG